MYVFEPGLPLKINNSEENLQHINSHMSQVIGNHELKNQIKILPFIVEFNI